MRTLPEKSFTIPATSKSSTCTHKAKKNEIDYSNQKVPFLFFLFPFSLQVSPPPPISFLLEVYTSLQMSVKVSVPICFFTFFERQKWGAGYCSQWAGFREVALAASSALALGARLMHLAGAITRGGDAGTGRMLRPGLFTGTTSGQSE